LPIFDFQLPIGLEENDGANFAQKNDTTRVISNRQLEMGNRK